MVHESISGFWLLCDTKGVIQEAHLPDKTGSNFHGTHFTFLFRLRGRDTLEKFLGRVVENKTRLSGCKAMLPGGGRQVALTGGYLDGRVLICGSTGKTSSEALFASALLMLLNRDHPGRNSRTGMQGQEDSGFYDKLMAINNELIDTKRELYKTNYKLTELNLEKDKFLSVLAHDLRSPFSLLIGFSEMLVQRINENNREKSLLYADSMLKTSKKTYSLLENLLEWSRNETGQLGFNPTKILLAHPVNNGIHFIEDMASQKNVTVRSEVDTDLFVFADENMLDTVLRNLVSNAVKFSNKDGGVIISAVPDKNMVTVNVADNGIGMDETTKKTLFSLMAESRRGTANESGSGLGLVLCRNFIEKNGGRIWVESEPGHGSVFRFTLPVAPDPNG